MDYQQSGYIAEYEIMEKEDRFHFIISQLENDLKSKYKTGINRFESILDIFGFSGPVDQDIKQNLFELSQVRNVIVHRSGIVDRRFTCACPWLRMNPGDNIQINHEIYFGYSNSVASYTYILLRRVLDRFEIPPSFWNQLNYNITREE